MALSSMSSGATHGELQVEKPQKMQLEPRCDTSRSLENQKPNVDVGTHVAEYEFVNVDLAQGATPAAG